MPLTRDDTPLGLVELYTDNYPLMDLLRRDKCDSVPPECYIPIAAGVETLRYLHPELSRQELAAGGAEVTCLYIWQKSKVMYQFDDDLAAALAEQAEQQTEEPLPVELLLHPPHPCIYIRSKYFRQYHADGFFTWIEWDPDRKEYELRWQFVDDTTEFSFGYAMHLSRPTIRECLAETVKESRKWEWYYREQGSSFPDGEAPEKLPIPLALGLEMILYLSADNRDEEEDRGQRAANRRAKSKSKTWRKQNTPDSIRLNNVGVRVGAALRKAKESAPNSGTSTGTGAKKITHLRRGHWHHYWTGPKADPEQRKLILKWTAPTVINPPDDDGAESNVVIYPVR